MRCKHINSSRRIEVPKPSVLWVFSVTPRYGVQVRTQKLTVPPAPLPPHPSSPLEPQTKNQAPHSLFTTTLISLLFLQHIIRSLLILILLSSNTQLPQVFVRPVDGTLSSTYSTLWNAVGRLLPVSGFLGLGSYQYFCCCCRLKVRHSGFGDALKLSFCFWCWCGDG